MRIGYQGRTAEPGEREVDPWGLVAKDRLWYLIAGTPQGRRTFRVDRISSVALLEASFELPADFDLAAAWAEIASRMEDLRSLTEAVVEVPTNKVFVLRDHFGRHCEVLSQAGDRSRVRVAAPTPLDVARWLAGWGADAVVLSPDSVRAELARLGRELVAAYPE